MYKYVQTYMASYWLGIKFGNNWGINIGLENQLASKDLESLKHQLVAWRHENFSIELFSGNILFAIEMKSHYIKNGNFIIYKLHFGNKIHSQLNWNYLRFD